MEKFVLVDGYIKLNNVQLFLDINEFKKDLKNRGGWLGVFFTFLGLSLLHNIKDVEYFEKLFNIFDFGLRILGMIAIIIILWYLFFKKKSKKNLIINEIESIDINKEELETELTLKFDNKKEIELKFRNLENQINPFIESLKRRNSRIKVNNI